MPRVSTLNRAVRSRTSLPPLRYGESPSPWRTLIEQSNWASSETPVLRVLSAAPGRGREHQDIQAVHQDEIVSDPLL